MEEVDLMSFSSDAEPLQKRQQEENEAAELRRVEGELAAV
jgi:hypothetical protein